MAAGRILRGLRSAVQKSNSFSPLSCPSLSVSPLLRRSFLDSSSSSGGWIRNYVAVGRASLTGEICSVDRILRQRSRFLSTDTTNIDKAQAGGNEQKETISVTFVDKDGEEKNIKVPVGMSMLEAAHENDIDLEGACEGSLACSTCHVIMMDVDYYNKLEEPTDEENDMLDLAFGLTETSRLGCQVIASPELDGIRLALPAATRNFAVDGYVPKPH